MLTNEDISMLMEALDALQGKDARDCLTGAFLRAAMLRNESKEDFEKAVRDDFEEVRQKSEAIKDSIIMLKAKLIQMRDAQTVSQMADVLKGEQES